VLSVCKQGAAARPVGNGKDEGRTERPRDEVRASCASCGAGWASAGPTCAVGPGGHAARTPERCSSMVAGVNEAAADGHRHRLGATLGAELAEDAGHID